MFSYYPSIILHRRATPMRQAILVANRLTRPPVVLYRVLRVDLKIPRLIKLQNKADERLFLKYINYIFGVLDIHSVIIDHPTM